MTGPRTLLVLDGRTGTAVPGLQVRTPGEKELPGTGVDVLVVGAGAAVFERRHRTMLEQAPDVRLLDVGALAPGASRRVSRFLVDFIHHLPSIDLDGRRLGDLLHEEGANLWWSMKVSEKSSFRGPLAERLYRLALVEEARIRGQYESVSVSVADPVLADAIAGTPRDARRGSFARTYWRGAAAATVRWMATRLVSAAAGWRTPAPRESLGIFTLFPYWWIEPFGARPVERFFSAPPPNAHYVAWLTWPSRIWRNRRALTDTLRRATIVPLQRFIRWRDVATMLSPRRYRRLSRARDAVLRHLTARFASFDVSAMVAEDVAGSMADGELFFDHLVAAGMTRYLAAARPRALAFRVEGQPWEHALLHAAKASRVPAVGFFHSMYGENYAALRFADGELAGADRGAGPRPVAGRMLVSGTTVEEYLVKDGYARQAIARCGPQRHATFLEFLRNRPSRDALRQRLALPSHVPIYFVAIAIVEIETEGLFACLEQALAGVDAFHVLIKTHPNRPAGDASMHAAIESLGDGRVTLVPAGGDMYEYMAASDTMVTIGSTVAFEAMALDVMPVVYEHAGTFAVLSLRAFEDALYVVNSPASMRAALEEIRAEAPGAVRRRERWPATLAGVLGDRQVPLEQQMTRALAQLGIP